MPKYCCQNCGAIFFGWGVKGTCQKCGGKLELIEEIERIEKIEDDIADIKLQNKVNEYKEKYPEHFRKW
jgi:transcription initiation factor IIE alpha subunit